MPLRTALTIAIKLPTLSTGNVRSQMDFEARAASRTEPATDDGLQSYVRFDRGSRSDAIRFADTV